MIIDSSNRYWFKLTLESTQRTRVQEVSLLSRDKMHDSNHLLHNYIFPINHVQWVHTQINFKSSRET